MAEVARGSVGERPFARTVYHIAAKGFTGDLSVLHAGGTYKVTWREGAVVAAGSPHVEDTLESVVMASGLATHAQVAAVFDQMGSTQGQTIWQLLGESAHIRRQDLLSLRRRMLAQRAARIFSLDDATFVLDDQPTLEAEADLPALEATSFIYNALLAHYDERRLADELGDVSAGAFSLDAEVEATAEALGGGEEETRFLAELSRRPMRIRELATTSPRLDSRTKLTILYTLYVTQRLEVALPAQPRRVKRPDAAAKPTLAGLLPSPEALVPPLARPGKAANVDSPASSRADQASETGQAQRHVARSCDRCGKRALLTRQKNAADLCDDCILEKQKAARKLVAAKTLW